MECMECFSSRFEYLIHTYNVSSRTIMDGKHDEKINKFKLPPDPVSVNIQFQDCFAVSFSSNISTAQLLYLFKISYFISTWITLHCRIHIRFHSTSPKAVPMIGAYLMLNIPSGLCAKPSKLVLTMSL